MDELLGAGIVVGPKMVLVLGLTMVDIRKERELRPDPEDIKFIVQGGTGPLTLKVVRLYMHSRFTYKDPSAMNFNFGMLLLEEDIGYSTGWLGLSPLSLEDIAKVTLNLGRATFKVSDCSEYQLRYQPCKEAMGTPILMRNKGEQCFVVGLHVEEGVALKLSREVYYEAVAFVAYFLRDKEVSIQARKAMVEGRMEGRE
jgi:hypothetical protein